MTEFRLHIACAAFLDLALPDGAFWFHVPNAGRRRKGAAGRLKAMGMKAGIPDLCIIYQGQVAFVELKTDKGRLSKVQREMHTRLAFAGAPVLSECRSVDALEAFLREIMPLKARVAA